MTFEQRPEVEGGGKSSTVAPGQYLHDLIPEQVGAVSVAAVGEPPGRQEVCVVILGIPVRPLAFALSDMGSC